MEGWRVAELKRLPKPLLNRLAALFNVIEKTSRWPKCLERSLVTLVQKSTGHNTNPEDLRPITVMSAIYRLWASTRVRNVMEWQEQWAAQGQHGGRTGRGTDDVYWQLALQLEEALCSGRPLYGCCLDYSKCFDRLPQRILLRLAKELGMNELVLAPLTAMYSNLRRRFKYAGFVGEEYTTTNGILQGCPLSMVLLNALVSVWCRAVEVEAPDATASAYVDDTYVTAGRPSAVNTALEVTADYAKLTGQQLSLGKCKGFTTATLRMRPLRLQGTALQQAHAIKAVGAQLKVNSEVEMPKESIRVTEARELTETLRWARLPWHIRADLLAGMAVPRGLFACAAVMLDKQQCAAWRQDILLALLGGRRTRHCAEIIFTLLTQGHRTDPLQAQKYQCLVSVHRMLSRRLDLRVTFCRVWAMHAGRAMANPGPVGIIYDTRRRLGWSWPEPFVFINEKGRHCDITTMNAGEWDHMVREALRMQAWQAAAARRVDMQGIEAGVQREITCCLLDSGQLTPKEKATLRSIQAGAIWTQERWHRASMAVSPVCPHCSTGEVEDHEHLWWRCPAWRKIRERHGEEHAVDVRSFPACFLRCGIVPQGMPTPLAQLKEAKPSNHSTALVVDLTIEADGRTCPHGELWRDGRVVVYTDGAARHNQQRLLRYAGYGAFWGHGHPFNISKPLQGEEQTNNRAELLAAIEVLEMEIRPVEVRTDSRYVANGALQGLERWRRGGRKAPRQQVKNADLWQRMDELLQARPSGEARIQKVKGHIAAEDVLAGKELAEDKEGNDAADGLAVAGAFVNERRGTSQKLQAQLMWTMKVQRMMLAILHERRQRRAEGHHSASSSKSRSSSCNSNSCSSSRSSCSNDSPSAFSISSGSASCDRQHQRRGRAAPGSPE